MNAAGKLQEIFERYRPEAELLAAYEGVELCSVELCEHTRSVTVTVEAGTLSPATVEELAAGLQTAYGCPFRVLVRRREGDLLEQIRTKLPATAAFLAGAELTLDGQTATVNLKHGGMALLRSMGFEEELRRLAPVGEVRYTGVCEIDSSDKAFVEEKKKELFAPESAVKKGGGAKIVKGEEDPDSPIDESEGKLLFGKAFTGKTKPLGNITGEDVGVVVWGEVFFYECSEMWDKKRKRFTLYITDYTSSLTAKLILFNDRAANLDGKIKVGSALKIKGKMEYDKYEDDLVLTPESIIEVKRRRRMDNAPEKRSELHLHTNMSAMDALTPVAEYIKRAKEWGHPAIAITDHGVVQSFPDAASTAKKIGYEGKVIYGLEAYFVNDCVPIVTGGDMPFDGEFCVFDVETTGLSPQTESLTEIGAVRISGGEIVDRFNTFVNPGKPIPLKIVELTGITDQMVKDAPAPAEAVAQFLEFAKGAALVAHNAKFDLSFIGAVDPAVNAHPALDTLILARFLYKDLKNHKLNTIVDHLKVGPFNHHRACDDAEVTARVLLKMLAQLREEHGLSAIAEINRIAAGNLDIKKSRSNHQILLIKNDVGRGNLYRLVSKSSIEYFSKTPRIPKSELLKHREGLIIGSACEAGEVFRAILDNRPESELLEIASFYDYLEIQPISNNRFLLESGRVKDEEGLRELNRRVVRLGEKLHKPVVATGDVHYIDPEQEVFRRVLLASKGFSDADKPLPLYFRTTEEMLEEFSYLGAEKAFEVVVTNPKKIADMCEVIKPVPGGGKLYPPEIPGAEEELAELSRAKAKEIYGEKLPPQVEKRMERELDSIIKHGFAVMYIIAQRLVSKSLSDGYLVGSRGSVGSSFVAFLSGITEVNSLAPHYICRNCHTTEFAPEGEYEAGCDLPDKVCPNCGQPFAKDGFDIPFETFLGFEGDKTPDIDLNFSGDYQPKAHKYTEVLFGEGYVFRAGTIGTLAEKTAFGYVAKYMEERGLNPRKAERMRYAIGCTGVKRTTGQHPGGIVVVPKTKDIHDFTPVQRPADAQDTDIITTHFDYHKIDENLLKLDILGHDDPTVIRMLEDLTGVDAKKIPLDDKETMKLFSDISPLGIPEDDILSSVGSVALPEFGTRFVRGMLEETRPTTFGELVRISGLSHGTNVWLGNAQELIAKGVTNLRGSICTRDDIMNYLILKGVEPKTAFSIMEYVRKGRANKDGCMKPDWEAAMRACDVPDWYIESCVKIQYMFPKAHAVAYVMMAFRIAWFKVNYPYAFYAAYFTVRADDFDARYMIYGMETLLARYRELAALPKPTQKESAQLTILETGYEFYKRGLNFLPIDLYKSHSTKFQVLPEGLLPPLNSLPGLGTNAAIAIEKERENGEFLSIDELVQRTKVSKTVVEVLRDAGVLAGIPESAQISLF